MRQTGILILATTLVIVCIVALPLFAQRSQTAKETKIDVLKEKLDKKEKVLLIDVRDEDEVKSGSIPGSINLPMAQLDRLLEKIVLATPDISSGVVPKYIELVDEIRKHVRQTHAGGPHKTVLGGAKQPGLRARETQPRGGELWERAVVGPAIAEQGQ